MNKLAFIAAAGLASTAFGTTSFGGGSTGAIADNDPVGTSFTLDVASSGAIVSMDALNLDIAHTWVGDLVITLEHGGTTVTLLDRPGVPASTVGNGSDMDGVYGFADAGASWAPYEVTGGGSFVTVDTYELNNTDGSSLADFVGMDINGTWTLTISDNAGLDTGAVRGWDIVAKIPAPGTAALFGLGGLAATRRRR